MVVPEGCPPFVHHLSLALRVEVLGYLAHNADDFPLPGLQQRGIFFDEIEQVLFRIFWEAPGFFLFFALLDRNGAPQVVQVALDILLTLLGARLFLLSRQRRSAHIAVDALVHQGVAGVKYFFYRADAVLLFAVGDVALGKQQVINNGAGIRPLPEQVVAFEE